MIQMPDDKSINPHGLMNEGIISTQLGLPGKPAMAEELIVARDIKLARYAGSKLHFTGVSTKKSLEYIKEEKKAAPQLVVLSHRDIIFSFVMRICRDMIPT